MNGKYIEIAFRFNGDTMMNLGKWTHRKAQREAQGKADKMEINNEK